MLLVLTGPFMAVRSMPSSSSSSECAGNVLLIMVDAALHSLDCSLAVIRWPGDTDSEQIIFQLID